MSSSPRPSTCSFPFSLFLVAASAAALGSIHLLSGCQGSATQTTNDAGMHGNLVDGDGNPVPGARVRVWRNLPGGSASPEASDQVPLASVTTDRSGNYSFKELMSGHFNLFAESEDGASTSAITGVAYSGEELDLGQDTLLPPGRVIGRVLADSAPLAEVFCYIPGSPYIAMTDSAGRFRLTGVPAGTHRLRFVREGYLTVDGEEWTLASGDTLELPDRDMSLNLALQPPTPTGLRASVDTVTGIITVAWDPLRVEDVDGYLLYGRNSTDDDSGTYSNGNLIRDTVYSDQHARQRFYQSQSIELGNRDSLVATYRLKAIDKDGNSSAAFSEEVSVLLRKPAFLKAEPFLHVAGDTSGTVCRDTLEFVSSLSGPTVTPDQVISYDWTINASGPGSPDFGLDIYRLKFDSILPPVSRLDTLRWFWGRGWEGEYAEMAPTWGMPPTLKVKATVITGSGLARAGWNRFMEIDIVSPGCYRIHPSRDPKPYEY